MTVCSCVMGSVAVAGVAAVDDAVVASDGDGVSVARLLMIANWLLSLFAVE